MKTYQVRLRATAVVETVIEVKADHLSAAHAVAYTLADQQALRGEHATWNISHIENRSARVVEVQEKP